MKRVLLVSIACVVLLLGAGCGNDEPAPEATSSEPQSQQSETIVKKQPADQDITSLAFETCEVAGFTIASQFIEDEDRTRLYCVFANDSACDVFAFHFGLCTPELGATAYLLPADEGSVLPCDPTTGPVCGSDGKTYGNECTAILQNVGIAQTGSCPGQSIEDLIDSFVDTLPDNAKVTVNIKGDISGLETDGSFQTPTAWIDMLKDLAQTGPKKSPAATIEQCTYSGTKLYYFSEGSGDAQVSTLYNQNGGLLCYPNNDLHNACPTFFNPATRGSNCSKIWQDDR